MSTLRELKGRIGSVASSEKITGAMKMISSAKMHKAEQALKRLLPYRTLIEGIIGNLLDTDADYSSPLTTPREQRHITMIVWGSDDGLCGAYNVNIYKELIGRLSKLRAENPQARFTIIPVGGKMAKAVGHLHLDRVEIGTARGVNSKSAGDDVKKFLDSLIADFTGGATDAVEILYMNFQSVSRQRPRFELLLPVEQSTFSVNGVRQNDRPCIFEPDANTIFRSIIPMFLLSVMQDVFTENRASEQAARIMAMQSANDNAKKLLDQLRLEYNKLRQQSITTELLDIVGGQVR